MARRFSDILLSSLILLFTTPLMALIAVVIKIDSSGPVLFLHVRTGINRRRNSCSAYTGVERRRKNLFGKQFVLYKFRTMSHDAIHKFQELYTYDYTDEEFRSLIVGQPFPGGNSDKTDPRISHVGKLLRKTSLDELPNFINVLKDDMSIVGPRPDIWQHIRYYPTSHLEKLKIKPGITCIAQIKGRGKLTFLETNECDLAYLKNQSFISYLRIIAKTIKTVILREGAF